MSSDLLILHCFLMKSQNDVNGNVEMSEYYSNSRRIRLAVDNTFHVICTQISMHAGNFPVCNRVEWAVIHTHYRQTQHRTPPGWSPLVYVYQSI